ncbi:MAG: winged helix DNA-binding protein [Vallitalea sp.]|jgi:DNA-binding MarR family transcriptional regulator|nr:winged helix DNA-binding protein [Vallitalea sp.]
MNYDCIVLKLRDVTTLTDKFYAKRIKDLGLPILMNHIPLFYILSGSEKPLAFTEIFNMWGISKSSLSEVINKYHKMGFIDKFSSADDKRSFTVALTEEGKKIRAVLSKLEEELLSKFYSNFGDSMRENFENNVEKVIENLRDI